MGICRGTRRTCEGFVVDDHADDGHGDGTVRSVRSYVSSLRWV